MITVKKGSAKKEEGDELQTSRLNDLKKVRDLLTQNNSKKPTNQEEIKNVKAALANGKTLYGLIDATYNAWIDGKRDARTRNNDEMTRLRAQEVDRLMRLGTIEEEIGKQSQIGLDIADRWDAFLFETREAGKDRTYPIEDDGKNVIPLRDEELAFIKSNVNEYAKFYKEANDNKEMSESLENEKKDIQKQSEESKKAIIVGKENVREFTNALKRINNAYDNFKRDFGMFLPSSSESSEEEEEEEEITSTEEQSENSNEMDIDVPVSKEEEPGEDVLPSGLAELIIPDIPLPVVTEQEAPVFIEGEENVKKASIYFAEFTDIKESEKHSSFICQYTAERVDTKEKVSIQIIPYEKDKSEIQADLYELLSRVDSFTKLLKFHYVKKFPASKFPLCPDMSAEMKNSPFHVYVSESLPALHLGNADYTRFTARDKLAILFELLDALEQAKMKYGIEHNALDELAAIRLIENAKPRSYKLSTAKGEDVIIDSQFKVLLTDFHSATHKKNTKSMMGPLLYGKDYKDFTSLLLKQDMRISDQFLKTMNELITNLPEGAGFDALKRIILNALPQEETINQ